MSANLNRVHATFEGEAIEAEAGASVAAAKHRDALKRILTVAGVK